MQIPLNFGLHCFYPIVDRDLSTQNFVGRLKEIRRIEVTIKRAWIPIFGKKATEPGLVIGCFVILGGTMMVARLEAPVTR
jgi:hypothetical protein